MAERIIAQRQVAPKSTPAVAQRQVAQRVIPTRIITPVSNAEKEEIQAEHRLEQKGVSMVSPCSDNDYFTQRYNEAMEVYNKYKQFPKSSFNPKRTRDILISLLDSDILAWDTETTSLHWTTGSLVCLTICNDPKKGFYIPWKHIQDNEENQKLLLAVYYTCNTMVGANIKFDLHYLLKNLPGLDLTRIKHIDDVGQLSHCINSNRTKGLKPLTYFYTPFGGYDNELDTYRAQTGVANYGMIPINILSKYATIDAIVTYRIYIALRNHVKWIDVNFPNDKPIGPDWNMEKWYDNFMMPVYPCFVRMEHRGMMLNKAYLDDVRERLKARIPEVTKKLCEIWNVPETFKFGSTVELGKQIQKMGWPAVELSKRGEYATSDDCIQEWKRQGRPGIKELIEWRELNSFLGTFVGEPAENGNQEDATGWEQFLIYHPEDNSWRIHQEYIINGTETFRCIGKNPNLQNVPVHSKLSDEVKRAITVPTAVHYKIESDDGNVYEGGELDTIEVKGKGRISLADVKETDDIIPGSFIKYKFEHDDVFENDDADWESVGRDKVYIHK